MTMIEIAVFILSFIGWLGRVCGAVDFGSDSKRMDWMAWCMSFPSFAQVFKASSHSGEFSVLQSKSQKVIGKFRKSSAMLC